MATTTPNYGWVVPTSTDLVKDGATAIETLGDSADATVKALNPETTLGDIAYRSATANTNTRLGIGSTGQILSVVGGVPAWAAPPASKILQVISASTTTSTVVASTSYTDSGLSATITPTSATSKILVLTSQVIALDRTANQANHGIRLLRGATSIGEFGDSGALYSMGFIVGGSTTIVQRTIMSINYMDSPATTSATTYKIQGACNTTANADTLTFQNQGLIGNMILMEVGA